MKIAVIGNMNNAGFAIMRYFRDLGAHTHLFPYSGDGRGCLTHFAPEADTWEIGKWAPFIHQLDMDDGMKLIIGSPLTLSPPPSKSHLARVFAGFDTFVGSGVAPALLARISRPLDIFFPYSTGIEHVGTLALRRAMRALPFRRPFLKHLRVKQIEGIRLARHCLNAEMSLTRAVFEEIGTAFLPLAIPAVYNREALGSHLVSPSLKPLTAKLNGVEFVVFSHARLMWMKDPHMTPEEWERASKHSDWLLRGYADFVREQPGACTRLLVVEYGPDVQATKALCHQLGLDDHVIWLPQMQRKEIMYLLSLCQVGVGEFYTEPGVIWGGTGWEVLASGRPLLQTFNFTEASFREMFGHPPPPILDVKESSDVSAHLDAMYRDRAKAEALGRQGRDWFDRHNGIALASQWLDLLQADRQHGVVAQ